MYCNSAFYTTSQPLSRHMMTYPPYFSTGCRGRDFLHAVPVPCSRQKSSTHLTDETVGRLRRGFIQLQALVAPERPGFLVLFSLVHLDRLARLSLRLASSDLQAVRVLFATRLAEPARCIRSYFLHCFQQKCYVYENKHSDRPLTVTTNTSIMAD